MKKIGKITSFQGEYRWLSNFWPAPVEYDGLIYPTVENAYQAAKTDPDLRLPFVNCPPEQAKRLGRKVPIRHGWENAKVNVMSTLLRKKFKDGELASRLLRTEGDEIIEGNGWGDTFWGICQGKGENNLGKLLMKIRGELKKGTPDASKTL